MKELVFKTQNRVELLDITKEVEKIVESSGVSDGWVTVFAPHSTAAVIVNEHESGLIKDYEEWLKKTFYTGGWEHNRIDDNAAAHLASAFTGCSRTLPVREGKVYKGTWQNIFLVELDGPRSERRVVVELVSS